LKQAIAGLPEHLPFVIAFFSLGAFFFAWRLGTIKSHYSRGEGTIHLTAPQRLRSRIAGVVAGLIGVLILAFAWYAHRLHADSGFEQLMAAVDRGDVGEVRTLLATKDPAIVNWQRGTGGGKRDNRPITFPLLVAAQRNQPEITRLLLAAGADPRPQDRQYRTALHFAVRPDDTAVMEILLDGGAPPRGGDIDGKTPLLLAVATGRIEPVEVLLSRGASIKDSTGENVTSLHLVTSPEIAALLCAYDAHPLWPDNSGATPARRATLRGDAAMAWFLSPDGGPCVWLHTRPGVASKAARETAVDDYRCEQLRIQAKPEHRQQQAASCLALGRALEAGSTELDPDAARARVVYERACSNGLAEACREGKRLAARLD
jgi:ankyrin repeat protein